MSKEKILIVDDDLDILDVLRITLEDEGYNITEAHNGQDQKKHPKTQRESARY